MLGVAIEFEDLPVLEDRAGLNDRPVGLGHPSRDVRRQDVPDALAPDVVEPEADAEPAAEEPETEAAGPVEGATPDEKNEETEEK